MKISQNLRFSGVAPVDKEYDHPPGISIARLLESKLEKMEWETQEIDNWRDCGWFFQCKKEKANLEIALAGNDKNEWMLQIKPAYLPGIIGKLFGKVPSAGSNECYVLAKQVSKILIEESNYSNFKWCRNGFPDKNKSTPEPIE
jgi:hypothetical protein